MKSVLQRATNSLLYRTGTGLQIQGESSDRSFLNQRYLDVVTQYESCFREFVAPDLPQCEGRVALMTKLFGTNVSEALYLLLSLHKSLPSAGEICEFGIAQGATSALMANEIRDTSKNLWLFDSFKGLPKPTAKDLLKDDIFNLGSMEKYQGTMACGANEVTERLNEIDFPLSRTRIVPGFIEETISLPGLPERICFAYVDFDFYEPISVALGFLGPRLSPGGHIVIDDYDFFSTGAKTAVDEFIAAQLPTFELVIPPAFAGKFAIVRHAIT